MMLFGMFGTFLIPMMIVGIFGPMVLYLVARWRDQREPLPDPQLGLKFALNFFKWQGYQVALVGVAVLIWSILTSMPSEFRETLWRPAFGALVPGLLVFGVASYALTRTNHLERPQVGRLIAGFNMMLTGIVGFGTLVMAFQVLFAKGESGEPGRTIWSFTVVYVGAWVAQTVLFFNATRPQMTVQPPV
jgi:hypothetical protein